MIKIIIALVAFFGSTICTPAARAHDCDPEEIADGECGRGVRIPSLRQLIPPAARPSAAAKGECDPDDADELKACLRALKVPGARQLAAPAAPHVTEAPTKEAPDKATALEPQTPVASIEKPASLDATQLCQRYFPAIAQSVTVPCSE